jgi:hypothetical protein
MRTDQTTDSDDSNSWLDPKYNPYVDHIKGATKFGLGAIIAIVVLILPIVTGASIGHYVLGGGPVVDGAESYTLIGATIGGIFTIGTLFYGITITEP